MKKQWTRISLGLILILAGVGYAGSVLGFWRFDLFFDGCFSSSPVCFPSWIKALKPEICWA